MKHIVLANFTKNKKNETVAIFLKNTIDYPSSKNANFFTSFDLLFLLARKVCFHSRILWNPLWCSIMPKIKRWKNWKFFNKTMDSPLWKNALFSTFFLVVFRCLGRRFFVLHYGKRQFPLLYCLKKKVGKMAIFGPKTWVNPFGKMSIFRLF